MHIAFFVSAHGFGHGARAAAVMTAVRARMPGCRIEVFSRLPEWFFNEAIDGPVLCHLLDTDVGVVQKTPFVSDLDATLARLSTFFPLLESQVRDIADGLLSRGCRAVVCDISALGVAVARTAKLPAILIENFTWDWLYAPHAVAHPDFRSFMGCFDHWYRQADMHIQTDPVCRPVPGTVRLGPMSRPAKQGRAATRRRLGIKGARPLVLLTMGGVTSRQQHLERLWTFPHITFVVPHDVPVPDCRNNIIILPHHSAFYHPDLVHAADLVVGKLGYSTLAEVGHAGVPFGYVLRNDSAESGPLAAYAEKHVRGRSFSEEAYDSGQWLTALEELCGLGPGAPAFENDAEAAATFVLSVAETGHPVPIRTFDPFGNRTDRDIRNSLSSAIVEAVRTGTPAPVDRVLHSLFRRSLTPGQEAYLEDRGRRSDRVFSRMDDQAQPFPRFLLLWNEGLFFEGHEYLEGFWMAAEGQKKRALQGLIKAAGVFVHRALGRSRNAERLAPKALAVIRAHREHLEGIGNIDRLEAALETPGEKPPELTEAPLEKRKRKR